MKIPLEARFWNKVHRTDKCWIFLGAKDKAGYGRININKINRTAHRVSYELVFGKIKGNKMVVCHKCDNPPCVNPDHLFLGTYKDNTQDMIIKGRKCNLTSDNVNSRKTKCPKKHSYTKENTGYKKNKGSIGRYCKKCVKDRYYAKKRTKNI